MIRGRGADAWQFGGEPGPWRAEVVREPGTTTADVYIEPARVETGRPFDIQVRLDDGSGATVTLRGGRADPGRRMPGKALQARWIGQVQSDRVGPGAGAGPDGRPDAAIALDRLAAGLEVEAVMVEAVGVGRWEAGPNPSGHPAAELSRGPDRGRAELTFQPTRDLAGVPLRVEVRYPGGRVDRAELAGGPVDPTRRIPAESAESIPSIELTARWLGQGGPDADPAGAVRVALGGLPAGRSIVAAAMGDGIKGSWAGPGGKGASLAADPNARPLSVDQGADRTRAEIAFAPYRDHDGSMMTLRLLFDDGTRRLARFPGGRSSIAPRSSGPDSSETRARPGDDLHDLVGRFGTIELAPGTYDLGRPLVLDRPVRIEAGPGTVLRFRQGPADPPWTAAIKIHEGNTRLRGFSVRFAGPIRWEPAVAFGPAIIGVTDDRDGGQRGFKAGIEILGLDLESPPAADPARWEEAPRLLRLIRAAGGRVAGNRLRGGMVEFEYGPWTIEDNEYRGTPAGTYSHAVFAGHETNDLVLRRNRARPEPRSGKTWRFLVLTGSGRGDAVVDNVVEGIGPRDGDTIPWMNAPELILTESYSLRFEGRPMASSPDGLVLRIPEPQGERVQAGDAVAILAGSGAGTWRRVVQPIEPTLLLLDEPLPAGVEALAIGPGFFGMTVEGNTIDARGGDGALPLVLVGNHFGTRIARNRLLGGGQSFKLTAAPTQQPVHWGWSHAPFLGVTFAENLVAGSKAGGVFAVEHGPSIRPARGRVGMTVAVRDNTFGPPREPLPAVRFGDPGSLDPGELRVEESGNRQGPGPAPRGSVPVRVEAATVNGVPVRERAFRWEGDLGASGVVRPAGAP